MNSRRLFLAIALLPSTLLLSASCARSNDEVGFSTSDGGPDATAADGSPANLGPVADAQSDGPCTLRCSDDLRSVVSCATGTDDCRGDPEFVNVIPPEQYLKSYTFFTDTTYPETNLVVVRKKSEEGKFEDVVLDCAGPLTGWQPAGRIPVHPHGFGQT